MYVFLQIYDIYSVLLFIEILDFTGIGFEESKFWNFRVKNKSQ